MREWVEEEKGVRLRFSVLLSCPRLSRCAWAKSIHLRPRLAIWPGIRAPCPLRVPRAFCPKYTLPALGAAGAIPHRRRRHQLSLPLVQKAVATCSTNDLLLLEDNALLA
jgi:hypothetical protein